LLLNNSSIPSVAQLRSPRSSDLMSAASNSSNAIDTHSTGHWATFLRQLRDHPLRTKVHQHAHTEFLVIIASTLSFFHHTPRHGAHSFIFHSQSILAASVSAAIDVILQLRAGSGVGMARVAKEAAIGFVFRYETVSSSAIGEVYSWLKMRPDSIACARVFDYFSAFFSRAEAQLFIFGTCC
jgi:hypothetical protein